MQSHYMYLTKKGKNRVFFSIGYEKVSLLGQSLFFWGVMTLSNGVVTFDAYGQGVIDVTKEKASSTIEFKREYLKHVISQQRRLVSSLIESQLMTNYLFSSIEQNRSNLEQLFLTVSEVNGNYMQVRFIDALGMEKIRIDQPKNGTGPLIVKENNLQDKSDRDYFKQAKKMPSGRILHSTFDLNKEQGIIEDSINPTFRVTSPVYFDGKFSGIVIINLEMSSVINHLIYSTDFFIYFVDAENEFLIHPDPNKSWSKYLLGRSKYQEKSDVYTDSLEDIFKNGEGIRIILEPVSK